MSDKVEPYIKRDASLLEVSDILVADCHKLAFQVINPFTGKPTRATLVGFLDWKSTALVGYAVNEKVLQTQKEKITALQTSINLLSRSLTNQIETVDETQQVTVILDKFAKSLDSLDDFDHKTLATKGETKREAVRISTKEFLTVVDKIKSEFASDVFANPKDDSFESSVNQIYQTFDGLNFTPH